jgi:hypothetical protein
VPIAIKLHKLQLRSGGEDPRCLTNLAIDLIESGALEDGYAFAKRACELAPKDLISLNALAGAASLLGKTTDAIEAFKALARETERSGDEQLHQSIIHNLEQLMAGVPLNAVGFNTRSPRQVYGKPDDEYIAELYDQFSEDEWAAKIAKIEARLKPENQVEYLVDPRRGYRGKDINELSHATLKLMGTNRRFVEYIPVCFVPSKDLNGCTITAPSGNHVILLSSATTWITPFLMKCTSAIENWRYSISSGSYNFKNNYCRALVQLAKFCTTGEITDLTQISEALRTEVEDIISFPMKESGVTTIAHAVLFEMFLLLHEYGHIVHGHEDVSRSGSGFIDAVEVMVCKKMQAEEFEADRFAVQMLLDYSELTQRLRPADLLVQPAILFGFWRIVEAYRAKNVVAGPEQVTHPDALLRWNKIAEFVKLENHPNSWVNNVQPWFTGLMESANLG